MSTAWSPIRSRQRETMIIRRPHSRFDSSSAKSRTRSTARRFARSISSSRSTSERRLRDPALERVERHTDHLLGALAHFLERLDKTVVLLDVGGELGQLGDRDAVVAHSLEMQVRVQHREDESQVDRDGRLPRKQRLDPLLDQK